MPYRAAKISFDGSHYIATPKENFPRGKKRRAVCPQSPKDVEIKEQFETAYTESQKLPLNERKAYIQEAMGETISDKEQRSEYSLNSHKRQIIIQNTYFNDKFGRNDFSPIDTERDIGSAVAYLMKYIGKSGERLVYSRGLPTYFVSDIMEKDVICTIGQEDRKLLLSDDFECWDEGCFVGKVSPETIRLLRKSN